MADSTTEGTEGAEGAKPIVVIAKRGDVLLKVGANPNEQATLLVSSTVLSLASKVFEAMFNSGFAEGQSLSSTMPYQLPLPDDDAKHMTIICKLVHMQTDAIPEKMPIAKLARFAALCDKYDCAYGLRAWSRMWLSWYGPNDSGFPVLLTVAYLLDLPQEFRKISQNLIQHYVLTTHVDLDIAGHCFLLSAVTEQIGSDQRRLQSYARAATVPESALKMLAHSSGNCGAARTGTLAFFQSLHAVGLFPSEVSPLESYRRGAQLFKVRHMKPSIDQCYLDSCVSFASVTKKLLDGIQAAFDSAHGFCLDCVNHKVRGMEKIACRVAHDPDTRFSEQSTTHSTGARDA